MSEELESVEEILSKDTYNSTIEMGKLFGVPQDTSEFIASIQDLIEKIDAMDVDD
jgi:hypothetical protein